MDAEAEPLERGPRSRAPGEELAAGASSRHSIQQAGDQPADRAAYEQGDDAAGAPRRKPGPVDEEA
jgi:hypothetical protein